MTYIYYSDILLSSLSISLSFAMMLLTISATSPNTIIMFVVSQILELLAVSSSITLILFLLVFELSIVCSWFALAVACWLLLPLLSTPLNFYPHNLAWSIVSCVLFCCCWYIPTQLLHFSTVQRALAQFQKFPHPLNMWLLSSSNNVLYNAVGLVGL